MYLKWSDILSAIILLSYIYFPHFLDHHNDVVIGIDVSDVDVITMLKKINNCLTTPTHTYLHTLTPNTQTNRFMLVHETCTTIYWSHPFLRLFSAYD